jgi:ribonuclease HI
VTTRRGASVFTKVIDLISPITAQWDEQILSDLFNAVDVQRILQIPLNNQGFDDFIAWKETSHGRYTVKSGYYLQWKHHFGPNAGQFSLPGISAQNPVWRILWKLKILSKIKIFIWRALHGIIPLKCILANRHIGDSAACPICHVHAEDVRHLLFTCPAAKEMWHILELQQWIDDTSLNELSGSVILEHIIRSPETTLPGFESVNLKEVVLTACWYLWWLRRRRSRDEPVPPISKCRFSIMSIVANSAAMKINRRPSAARWIKPNSREVKLNVDASFTHDLHAGALGAVLRDFEGKNLAGRMVYLSHVGSSQMAEALAMKEGLALANEMGVSNLIAESDSLETVEACSGDQQWHNESAAIFADCVDLVASIGNVSFAQCPREANMVAHNLARECFSAMSNCNWVDDPPSFILESLVNDVTIL